ncbi:MAG: prephenate dehydrogenase [Flavobacteriales bacterium]|nr:prephenate dehydrogenase [Flavobacteriales bacterium]MCB9449431.1 prephenate dehydrogenase [Flavobacteriales bacterium]
MQIAVVGLGLIGGSLAMDLKAAGFASKVTGVDSSVANAATALELGLIDEVATLDQALQHADLVVLSIPVIAIKEVLPKILDKIKPHQVVTDMGSTKASIARVIAGHPNRKQYVSSHPMAGTEHSGPRAAIPDLFRGKVGIICDKEASAPEAVQRVEDMYTVLGMRLLYMNADAHDMHAAYVSHISHISSFALALAVLEKEENEKAIFNLASGGFSSTVRLAKSSPEMWAQVYMENDKYILEVLDAYIAIVQQFRDEISAGHIDKLRRMMQEANAIRKVLDKPRESSEL